MDNLLVMQGAKRMAAFISASFLAVHVALVCVFHWCGVTPMVYFNIGSMLFYLISFIIIGKEVLWLYVDLVYVEVVAHMACAALLTGWEGDFQIAILGMSTLAYFAEYLCRSLGIRHVKALPMCLFGMVVYLICCVVCSLRPAPYPLVPEVNFGLRIAWGGIVFIISIMVLQVFMTRAFRSEQLLEGRLSHDKLTGLPNRYFISEYLGELVRSGDLANHWVAVADIDDFKKVNDTYGHNAGDAVLETVAGLLREGAGEGMPVCRWGGEEFLIVGLIGEDEAAVREHLERLRALVAGHPIWYESHRIAVTMTIGAAAYQEGQTTAEWINAADEQLYIGKTSGKNKVVM